MAVVMIMKWAGVTPEQYDQVRNIVKWETDVPKGGQIHIATFDGGALRVTDVWDSAEDMQAFVDKRLMPGVQQVGIQSQPDVEVHPMHALFTPGFNPK